MVFEPTFLTIENQDCIHLTFIILTSLHSSKFHKSKTIINYPQVLSVSWNTILLDQKSYTHFEQLNDLLQATQLS